jgi:hypothetical protein
MKQASRPVDKGEARPIFQYNRRLGGGAMLPKSVIACLAASAFATGALMPTGASAVKGRSHARHLELATLRWKRRHARKAYMQLCAGRDLSS